MKRLIILLLTFGISVVGQANAVVPPAPPGLNPTTTTFTQATPTAIPDQGTITSTIAVNITEGVVFDIDLTTTLTHPTTQTLVITLESPSGTNVTISSNNGAANVFNGTVWDDSASTLPTRFTYTDNVTATPLAPEEPLGALIGENPNGTWALHVTDGAAGNTGILASWALTITMIDTTPTTTLTNFNNTTPVAIPDVTTVTSTLVVTGLDPYLFDLNLTTSITHTSNNDLRINLSSPNGTTVAITLENGFSFDNVFNGTTWDDEAGTPVTDFPFVNNVTASPITPQQPFAAFIGQDPNGLWTLSIEDDATLDTGTLSNWQLAITTVNIVPAFASTPAPNSTINVGTVLIGNNISTPLVVSEIGNADLVVDSATLSGTNAGDFSLANGPPFTILEGGAAVTMTITCRPSSAGLRTALLEMTTNDPQNATVGYSLECTGQTPTQPPTQAPPIVGTFTPSSLVISKVGAFDTGELGLIGDTLIWTISITNPNPFIVSNTTLTDTVQSELTIENVTTTKGTPVINAQTVTIVIGNLSAYETVTIRIITSIHKLSAEFINTATVTADQFLNSVTATVAGITGLPNTGYPPQETE